MSDLVNIAVIEDEHLLADLLGEWVDAQPDLHLVGAFRSLAEARSGLMGRSLDVMVVDLDLPDGSGIDLAADAASGALGCQRPKGVVILSGLARPDLVVELPHRIDATWAYLLKSTNTTRRLRHAIDAVVSGLVMIDPELHRLGDEAAPRLAVLTESEREVLSAMAAGNSNRAIAEIVHVSVKTVERMLSSIYLKLGIDARDETLNPRVQAVLVFAEATGAATRRR
jgi:two-component system, NarL family, response regulator DesR